MTNGTVYRYSLDITDRQTVSIPRGARFLSFREYQHDSESLTVSMWWLVPDPDAPAEPREFVIVGTGNPIFHDLDDLTPLGTAITPVLRSNVYMPAFLVWHLFELRTGKGEA